jgi:Leucine-rich repeat (LRR) protein
MENIETIYLSDTCIEELPDSFQNLTGLEDLSLNRGVLLSLPSSILMMPKLLAIYVKNCHLLPKQCDKPNSMVCSNKQLIMLVDCNLNDETLPIVLKWFANVRHLYLSGNNFTILPLCIKEHGSLETLVLDNCKFLQEIRGIPPNLKYLSAVNCDSLSSSCRSMLLKQVLFFLVFDFVFRILLYLSKLTSYL